jgi:hypothetical protein
MQAANEKIKILFLCTGNFRRGQRAEGPMVPERTYPHALLSVLFLRF